MALEDTIKEMKKITRGLLMENKDISDEKWFKELYEINKKFDKILSLLS